MSRGQCTYLPIGSTRKFEKWSSLEVAWFTNLKNIYDWQAKGSSIGWISKDECHAYIKHNQYLRSFIELSTALKTMARNIRLQRVDAHANVLTSLWKDISKMSKEDDVYSISLSGVYCEWASWCALCLNMWHQLGRVSRKTYTITYRITILQPSLLQSSLYSASVIARRIRSPYNSEDSDHERVYSITIILYGIVSLGNNNNNNKWS